MTAAYRLGLRDAADAFGVSYTAVWRAVRAGELPALQVGRRWLVRPEDVETWLQAIGTPNGAAS